MRSTAVQVRVAAEDKIIAEHPRCFGRDQLICDPWHYLPVLEKKPGALRNGAPFREWHLSQSIQRVRDLVLKQGHGDRAFVEMLLLARETGLETLEVACDLALEEPAVTASAVMNTMRRLTAPAAPEALDLPQQMKLTLEPIADCSRYDGLRVICPEVSHVH